MGDTGTVRVPDRARRIDGLGKFLIPGLIDTHVHLAVRADRDELRLIGPLLANGVTGVRDAGASGQDAWLVALRDRIPRGEIVAPRLYVSGMVSGRSLARAAVKNAGATPDQLTVTSKMMGRDVAVHGNPPQFAGSHRPRACRY